jgi:rod shape determining protein RodA
VKGAAWHPRRPRGAFLGRILSARHLSLLRVDWHLLLLAMCLLGIGLLFVRSMDEADILFERSDGERVDFALHLRKLLFAVPMLVLAALVRPRWLRRNAWRLYALSLGLLVLVRLVGDERNGARRWIQIPGLRFDLQPSELAKLGLIVALARLFYTARLARAGDWLRTALVVALPAGLVALQPDLGTAMTLAPIALGMMFLAGARPLRLAQLGAAGALCFALSLQFRLVHAYQLERVHTWLESFDSERLIEGKNGPAFHTYHARVAIGNGGWFGRGLGEGVANEAAHLPERESDSIFAVVAEEAGFVGAGGILLLYLLLVVLILGMASTIRERFSRLVVGGVGLYFAAHLFIHVGVNLGLIPLTGLPLPLFSTGGSSLLATCTALGLALGLAAQREATLDGDAFRE